MAKDGGFTGFVDSNRAKPWIAAMRGTAQGSGPATQRVDDDGGGSGGHSVQHGHPHARTRLNLTL
ncbi:hypothetical protein [Aquisediminimonas sediminicola]|uniref:hypothetical protein n=1 Tax=Alteraquisediminimonas sediminicola TaxID=2676787 RepID=UPI001C8D4F94|nr:hypothetical protein [Aquisediminimonas sediminicola]